MSISGQGGRRQRGMRRMWTGVGSARRTARCARPAHSDYGEFVASRMADWDRRTAGGGLFTPK